jgi:hypothetical protein
VDHLAGLGAHRQILVGLADDFAGMAPDAVFGVLKKVVLAHSRILLKPFWKAEYGAQRHFDRKKHVFVGVASSHDHVAARCRSH